MVVNHAERSAKLKTTIRNFSLAAVAAFGVLSAAAETIVDVSGVGTAKFSVSVNVSNAMFAKSLTKNLELSGLFKVEPNGSVKVTGTPGAIKAEGRGKVLRSQEAFSDDKSARMAARKLSDAMVAAFSNGEQKGFALDRVVFMNRGRMQGGRETPGELCVAYPDGYDIRQLTSDGRTALGARWKGRDSIYYVSYLKDSPRAYEVEVATGRRQPVWKDIAVSSPAVLSPDGTKVAVVASFQGNNELYIFANGRYTRLTNTPNASEGTPTWSPDGKKIAYVSDEARGQQIYVVDVATKAKRRLTNRGRKNIDPDWGRDGRIVYISGNQVAVMSPADGDKSSRYVTEPANWEHPSWSRDARHVVANRDKALFVIDTLEGGDKPRQMFFANGNWISPCWAK